MLITVSLILGLIGSLGLIFFGFLDLIKRYVFIYPYVAAAALTSVSVILNYQTFGSLTLLKVIVAAWIPVILFLINFYDMKFNKEDKIGGADVLGGSAIALTIIGVFIISSAEGEYSLLTTVVWIGSVVVYPALLAMVLLLIFEVVYTYVYNKRHDEKRAFAAPMVPVISFILVYMFISSAVQYL